MVSFAGKAAPPPRGTAEPPKFASKVSPISRSDLVPLGSQRSMFSSRTAGQPELVGSFGQIPASDSNFTPRDSNSSEPFKPATVYNRSINISNNVINNIISNSNFLTTQVVGNPMPPHRRHSCDSPIISPSRGDISEYRRRLYDNIGSWDNGQTARGHPDNSDPTDAFTESGTPGIMASPAMGQCIYVATPSSAHTTPVSTPYSPMPSPSGFFSSKPMAASLNLPTIPRHSPCETTTPCSIVGQSTVSTLSCPVTPAWPTAPAPLTPFPLSTSSSYTHYESLNCYRICKAFPAHAPFFYLNFYMCLIVLVEVMTDIDTFGEYLLHQFRTSDNFIGLSLKAFQGSTYSGISGALLPLLWSHSSQFCAMFVFLINVYGMFRHTNVLVVCLTIVVNLILVPTYIGNDTDDMLLYRVYLLSVLLSSVAFISAFKSVRLYGDLPIWEKETRAVGAADRIKGGDESGSQNLLPSASRSSNKDYRIIGNSTALKRLRQLFLQIIAFLYKWAISEASMDAMRGYVNGSSVESISRYVQNDGEDTLDKGTISTNHIRGLLHAKHVAIRHADRHSSITAHTFYGPMQIHASTRTTVHKCERDPSITASRVPGIGILQILWKLSGDLWRALTSTARSSRGSGRNAKDRSAKTDGSKKAGTQSPADEDRYVSAEGDTPMGKPRPPTEEPVPTVPKSTELLLYDVYHYRTLPCPPSTSLVLYMSTLATYTYACYHVVLLIHKLNDGYMTKATSCASHMSALLLYNMNNLGFSKGFIHAVADSFIEAAPVVSIGTNAIIATLLLTDTTRRLAIFLSLAHSTILLFLSPLFSLSSVIVSLLFLLTIDPSSFISGIEHVGGMLGLLAVSALLSLPIKAYSYYVNEESLHQELLGTWIWSFICVSILLCLYVVVSESRPATRALAKLRASFNNRTNLFSRFYQWLHLRVTGRPRMSAPSASNHTNKVKTESPQSSPIASDCSSMSSSFMGSRAAVGGYVCMRTSKAQGVFSNAFRGFVEYHNHAKECAGRNTRDRFEFSGVHPVDERLMSVTKKEITGEQAAYCYDDYYYHKLLLLSNRSSHSIFYLNTVDSNNEATNKGLSLRQLLTNAEGIDSSLPVGGSSLVDPCLGYSTLVLPSFDSLFESSAAAMKSDNSGLRVSGHRGSFPSGSRQGKGGVESPKMASGAMQLSDSKVRTPDGSFFLPDHTDLSRPTSPQHNLVSEEARGARRQGSAGYNETLAEEALATSSQVPYMRARVRRHSTSPAGSYLSCVSEKKYGPQKIKDEMCGKQAFVILKIQYKYYNTLRANCRLMPLILIVIMASIGCMPFLGLRTYPIFSSFTNARYEGVKSNHWLLGRQPFGSGSSWGLMQEYVTILQTDVAELHNYEVDLADHYVARRKEFLRDHGVEDNLFSKNWRLSRLVESFSPFSIPMIELRRILQRARETAASSQEEFLIVFDTADKETLLYKYGNGESQIYHKHSVDEHGNVIWYSHGQDDPAMHIKDQMTVPFDIFSSAGAVKTDSTYKTYISNFLTGATSFNDEIAFCRA